jgi:hypothetical protein
MKKFLLSAAILVGSIGIANASTVVFSDNFDSNTLGLNKSPSNWTVTSGTVDIIGSSGASNFFNFIPGNGKYIDLDGSTWKSGILSKSFDAVAGNTYTAMFDLGGGHRGQTDSVSVSFGGVTQNFSRGSSAIFSKETMTFTATALTAGTTYLSFHNAGGDNMGALLDNVNVTSVTPVPEPEEWAMMLLGLPLMGFVSARRRKLA